MGYVARLAAKGPLLRILLQCPRGRLIGALVACAVGAVAGVVMVALVNAALVPNADLRLLASGFFACVVVNIVARVASGVSFAALGEGALLSIRSEMAQRIASAPYRRIEALGASRVQSVITDDAAKVADFLVSAPHILMNATMVAGCLTYLAWLSFSAFVFAALVIVAGSLIFHLGNIRALKVLDEAGLAQDELFKHFEGLFLGAKELKLNEARAQAFLDQSLRRSVEDVRRLRLRGLRTYVMAMSAALFLVYALVGALTFGTGAAAAGSTIVFLYLMIPLDSLLAALPNAQHARVAMERIERVLHEADAPEPSVAAAPDTGFHELRLEGVSHRYYRDAEDGVFTLGPIDLTLKPAEIVMLIGGNGSGKTTLAKVLTGLYAPDDGAILLDGERIVDADRGRLRALFSTVFSDFHLFPTLDGVAAGGEGDLDARANELIARLRLSHKVSVAGGRLSTRALSQGQRKRLALVAAYLEDRPFYLFDEWAADQDPEFREVFYRTLLPELRQRGKAVLAISHDDRYFPVADRCVKLENGAVADIFVARASRESAA
ncbi:cyclic peptide export ABC transporter [Methylocella sp.]|uniref:cyclic peptide export ABC transporter n=1 Tax=Methylocella sp. TaxID=1978226 RepID=UPI0037845651